MSKLAVTGIGGILGVAVLSTILMVANSPARSVDAGISAPGSMERTGDNTGRVTLNFESASHTVDRL